MDAGAFGFSSTILNQHVGFEGKPSPAAMPAARS